MVCPNCNQELKNGGHFVPPCLGDPGFYVCKKVHYCPCGDVADHKCGDGHSCGDCCAKRSHE